MSEHIPISPEKIEHKGHTETTEQVKHQPEQAQVEHGPKQHLPELQQTAHKEALPARHTTVAEHSPHANQHTPHTVSREFKHLTFQRTLTRVAKRLPASDRALSKVIHQPVVDTLSRAGEKTVARPSGLLGGSICAFVGSSILLWAARHYGFRYNYLVFFLLFAGGFALGSILELLIYVLRRRNQG